MIAIALAAGLLLAVPQQGLPPERPHTSPPSNFDELLARRRAQPIAAAAPGDATAPVSLDGLPFLDLIQTRLKNPKGPQPLLAAERKHLEQQGFVILGERNFGSFGEALYDVFGNDQPLFITSDMMLHAFHKTYDGLLSDLESGPLSQLLAETLEKTAAGVKEIRRELGSDPVVAEAAEDVRFLLEVAAGLLKGAVNDPSPRVAQALQAAMAEKPCTLSFLGCPRDIDFSQFRPRGHYTKSAALKQYFRAMMWLGRADLAFQIDKRYRETVAAFLLADAMRRGWAFPAWDEFDRWICFLVGAPDGANPRDLMTLLSKLGYSSFEHFVRAARPAETLKAIGQGDIGAQKILSAIVLKSPGAPAIKLPKSAQLLGQRFTLDSYVFNQLTFDRIPNGVPRMMPSPLDVAAAVFGQPRALELLKPDFEKYRHEASLAACADYVKGVPAAFWEESVYHGWLDALGALSVADDRRPPLLRTRAWADLKLNTQLASWAQLRHDTVLYVKQSYSVGITCEFCDVAVEPCPAFYAKLAALCGRLTALLSGPHPGTKETAELLKRYHERFTKFGQALGRLREAAEGALDGKAPTKELRDFLHNALELKINSRGCGRPEYFLSGWYPALFPAPLDALEWLPTIADVHTQPTDENGGIVGRVLHAGVGNVNLAAFIAKGHDGISRAYLGPVFSYYEQIESDFNRLTDEAWKLRLGRPSGVLHDGAAPPQGPPPQRPAWAEALLGR